MEVNHAPGKFEAELDTLNRMEKLACRARARRGHPLTNLEDYIRKRKEIINAAVQKSNDLKIRLSHFRKMHLNKANKTQEFQTQMRSMTYPSNQFSRKVSEAVEDTANALHVSEPNTAVTKEEVPIKSEASVD